MADNQIEKVIATNGDGGTEPVPIATNDSPGIASFDRHDFIVDSNGKVEAKTKLGISHILNYKGTDGTNDLYTITKSLGKQQAVPGDLGLVMSDEVNPSIEDEGTKIGDVVRLVSIETTSEWPEVFAGDFVGRLTGPRGAQGIQGETGAIQHVAYTTSLTGNYFKASATFTRDKLIHEGDLALVVDDTENTGKIGPVYLIEIPDNPNTDFSIDFTRGGSIRGPKGKDGSSTVLGVYHDTQYDVTYRWRVMAGITPVVGDLLVAAIFEDSKLPVDVNQGDMFVVTKVDSEGFAVTLTVPQIKNPSITVGIFALTELVGELPIDEQESVLIWKIASIDGSVPVAGAIGLVMDDDNEHFGKILTMNAVECMANADVIPEEFADKISVGDYVATTSSVGSSIIGPPPKINIGEVTTVQNDETGMPGEATASVTEVDRFSSKLNLGIPAGPKGEQGIQGPQGPAGPAGVANVNSKGPWKEDAVYYRNDLVYWPGDENTKAGSYICSVVSTTSSPASAPDEWGFFVAEGPQGPVGPVGPEGPEGPQGPVGPQGDSVTSAVMGTPITNNEYTITPITFTVGGKDWTPVNVMAKNGSTLYLHTITLSPSTPAMPGFTIRCLSADSTEVMSIANIANRLQYPFAFNALMLVGSDCNVARQWIIAMAKDVAYSDESRLITYAAGYNNANMIFALWDSNCKVHDIVTAL